MRKKNYFYFLNYNFWVHEKNYYQSYYFEENFMEG